MLFQRNQTPSPPRRVVITGAGIVTGHGFGWDVNAQKFRSGVCSIGLVKSWDVSRQRVKVAAEAPEPFPPLPDWISRRVSQRWDRAMHLLFHAAAECWKSSGWKSEMHAPLVLGTTSGGMRLGEAYYCQALDHPRDHRGQPSRVAHYLAQEQARSLIELFGLQCGATLIANACASGANAIGHAWHLIAGGRSDVAWAGGYDALSSLVFAGFDSLQALSPTRCRPFSAQRDGLALGEGAALLAMESLDHAQARGAHILAEVCGYGAFTDVHHLTQPHPQGDAALASMQNACAAAGVGPEQIGYLNAHGTGTPLNDAAEAAAISRWAGDRVTSLAVSSTKFGIGHLLGAAGAVETVVCCMALKGQWLPPQLTLDPIDPACRFALVQHRCDATQRLEYVLTNSFGFGGANASLILGRSP